MDIIDLFSGAGGLSLGFIQNGYNVKKAVEFDEQIANTYKKNFPQVDVIIDDIKKVDKTKIFEKNDGDVIIGGPPCQGFSMAGSRIRNNFINDPRNYLFKHYFNIVKTVKPKVFLMENVKGIETMQSGKIFREILHLFSDSELLEGKPYHIYYRIINASDFGVPQKRERMIIIGTTIGNINFIQKWEKTKDQLIKDVPSFFKKTNVWDAIGNLPETTEDGIIKNPIPITNYEKYLSSEFATIKNHKKTNHSKIAI